MVPRGTSPSPSTRSRSTTRSSPPPAPDPRISRSPAAFRAFSDVGPPLIHFAETLPYVRSHQRVRSGGQAHARTAVGGDRGNGRDGEYVLRGVRDDIGATGRCADRDKELPGRAVQ